MVFRKGSFSRRIRRCVVSGQQVHCEHPWKWVDQSVGCLERQEYSRVLHSKSIRSRNCLGPCNTTYRNPIVGRILSDLDKKENCGRSIPERTGLRMLTKKILIQIRWLRQLRQWNLPKGLESLYFLETWLRPRNNLRGLQMDCFCVVLEVNAKMEKIEISQPFIWSIETT